MIKIKFKKNKNNTNYKIIIIKNKSSIKGKYIEKIGYYNNNNMMKINIIRLRYWIKLGVIENKLLYFLKKKWKKYEYI